MALERIGWENGTLVESGKVLDDGTVQPAQYEGSTPLNATNLQAMENNVENFVNEEIQTILDAITPVTLYENSSGTYENFTLNDSVSNYSYIDIISYQSGYGNTTATSRLYEPNGKTIRINRQRYDGSTSGYDRLQNFGMNLTFLGTTVTVSGRYGYVVGTGNYGTYSDTMYVTKVIGYKGL